MRILSLTVILALAVTGMTPDAGLANSKKGKQVPPGQVKRQMNGPKPMPPGQAKRYMRGDVIGKGVKYYDVTDWNRYKLGKPPKGEKYVRIGDQILRVAVTTLAVVAVVGLVDELLD